ncbi:ATP-binding protein [Clostridium sp.]|uniref:MASE3 domain-containing sensor histidine kinase n=1 Tax=Clostridium sp. TaxID=1506 RepID=UPI002582C7E6|nr:ATP-binding protein [Clostridium sp.]MDF2504811.1 domain S-box [Clostridium sp.]
MKKIDEIKLNLSIGKELKIEIIIISIFIGVIILMTQNDLSALNITMDFISSVASLSIFIISASTYKYLKNNSMILLGMCYAVLAVISLIYVITYTGLSSLTIANVSFINEFNGIKNYVQVIIAIILICIDFKYRDDYNKSIFNMIFLAAVFIIISQFLYNFYGYSNKIIYIFSQVIEFISFYLIYKITVHLSIKKPYNKFFSELNSLNTKLKEKKLQLEKINNKLKKQNIKEDSTAFALKKASQRYRTVLSLSPNAIIISKHNKFIFANKAALDLFKLKSTKQIIEKDILDFVHRDYHELVKKRMEIARQNGKACPFVEEKYIDIEGNEVFVKATAASIPYDRDIVMTIARDITESKKAEENEKLLQQVLQSDKIRKDFFANISHELRTPLNVIFTAVQLLEMNFKNLKISDNNLNKYLNMTKQNCYRLLKLINNLIDITKIDSGYFNINMENCDIVRVVEDTSMSIAEYIKSKNIQLIFDTDMEEKYIACDEEKMSRVIINLLSNAVKFTKPGGKIMVNIYDKGNKVLISVKDTGIGIPEKMRNSIFERFIQAKESIAKECGGSGIGLSIVKALIEMHNGKVWVESEEGKGSEFLIELPVLLLDKDKISENHNLVSNRKNIVNIEFSDIVG